jgi:hypothetical protein
MPKRKWPATVLVVLLLTALSAGLFYLAGTGATSYPKMSSLNTGPNGAKLLFDALSRMPALSVRRNLLPSSQWHPSSTTILVLGMQPARLNLAEKDDLVELEQLAQKSNRIVLAIDDNNFIGKPAPKEPFLMKSRWGIQILRAAKSTDKDPDLTLDFDSSWQPVNGIDDAVEKHFASAGGTIVVALHSEDLSNETLATDATVLDEIAPLLGPQTSVVFDETHLGIEESGSIASLALRFKLQGLIAGLVLLVGLFIWNQSVSFPPPPSFQRQHDNQLQGADARGMFASLIARHLTPQALIESCVAEWNRVKPQQRITTEIPSKSDPVAVYQHLQENLHRKRSRT